MKAIPLHRLDRTSLEYLAAVDRTAGGSANGVFIRCPGSNVPPRRGQVIGLCVGLTVAAVALVSVAFLDFEQIDPRTAGHLQAVLLAAGLGLGAANLLALRRPIFQSPVGHFLWADERHFWEVTPGNVKVRALDEVRSANANHFVNHGSYSHSEVFLRLRSGSEVLMIASRTEADQLVKFLTVHCLPTEAAKQPNPSLPQPTERAEADEPAPSGGVGRALPWGVAVGAALLGVWTFPAFNDSLREERLYAATAEAAPGDERSFQQYLTAFPTSHRAEEVQSAFEDNLAGHTADSPLGWVDRYEKYRQRFPQGRLRDRVWAEYEDHLFRSAKVAEPGAEHVFQLYLTNFPSGRYISEVRANYEDNLYRATGNARVGEQNPFRRYLEMFRQGRRIDEVRTAYEDNLARYAAASPPGVEDRYQQYLNLFPQGKLSAAVRTGYEDNLYQFARVARVEEGARYGRYLEVFPKGRYVSEVKQLKDDHQFRRASSDARTQNSPAPLRQYLRDADNQRHRPEAQGQIDAMYDRAIDDLKNPMMPPKVKPDRVLAEAVIALLEALKKADSSVVSVGFKGKVTTAPVGVFTKALETEAYKSYLTEYPDLKELEKEKGTAMVPTGEVFDESQKERRERAIFQRLRTAAENRIRPDLLVLERVAPNTTPQFEIAYHVVPSGSLLVYYRSFNPREDDEEKEKVTRPLGLVRTYDLQWSLTLRLPGSDKVLEHKLTSRAATSMKLRPESSDPDWAPYTILMYLTFRDMSDRLSRSLGSEPGSVGKSLSFQQANSFQ